MFNRIAVLPLGLLIALSLACGSAAPADVIRPMDLSSAPGFMSQLSAAERSCLENDPSIQDRPEMLTCLENETVLRMFFSKLAMMAVEESLDAEEYLDGEKHLTVETSACIREGFTDFDIRNVMQEQIWPGSVETAADQPGGLPIMPVDTAGVLAVVSCLNDEEWQSLAPSIGIDREGLHCMVNTLGGLEGFMAALYPVSGLPVGFFLALEDCDLWGDDIGP